MSTCGASMEPAGRFQRPNGEYVIVHHCLDCDLERFNRIAADDDFERTRAVRLAFPSMMPRHATWCETLAASILCGPEHRLSISHICSGFLFGVRPPLSPGLPDAEHAKVTQSIVPHRVPEASQAENQE